MCVSIKCWEIQLQPLIPSHPLPLALLFNITIFLATKNATKTENKLKLKWGTKFHTWCNQIESFLFYYDYYFFFILKFNQRTFYDWLMQNELEAIKKFLALYYITLWMQKKNLVIIFMMDLWREILIFNKKFVTK